MFKTPDRNRALCAAFEAGRTIEQLCKDYDMSELRVRTILADEKNRQAVSPEPFYRALRKARSS
jgi:Mor family transcriptional regulator